MLFLLGRHECPLVSSVLLHSSYCPPLFRYIYQLQLPGWEGTEHRHKLIKTTGSPITLTDKMRTHHTERYRESNGEVSVM